MAQGRQQGQRKEKKPRFKGHATDIKLLEGSGVGSVSRYEFRLLADLGTMRRGEPIEFYAAGHRLGAKPTDEGGIAFGTWTYQTSAAEIEAMAQSVNQPYLKDFFLVDFSKAKPKTPELVIRDETTVGNKRIINLVRAGADGKPVQGEIRFFEDGKEEKVPNIKDGKVKFERELGDKGVVYNMFLPESPDVKVPVTIPAKEKRKPATLTIIRTNEQPEKLIIRIALADADGNAIHGKFIIDDPDTTKVAKKETDDEGFGVISVTRGKEDRTIFLNPSGAPTKLTPVEIPEISPKPKRISRKKPEPNFWEQLKAARQKGLEG